MLRSDWFCCPSKSALLGFCTCMPGFCPCMPGFTLHDRIQCRDWFWLWQHSKLAFLELAQPVIFPCLSPLCMQVVVLAAGFCTRAYRTAAAGRLPPGIRFYEIDLPRASQEKRDLISQLNKKVGDASHSLPCSWARDRGAYVPMYHAAHTHTHAHTCTRPPAHPQTQVHDLYFVARSILQSRRFPTLGPTCL